MFQNNDLDFMRDVFKKHRIESEIIKPENLKERIDSHITHVISGKNSADTQADKPDISEILSQTVYNFTDRFGFLYTFFQITEMPESEILLIGPYMHERLSASKAVEYADKNSLSAKQRKYLQDYYSSVQLVPRGGLFFTILNSFCERHWKRSDFNIIDVNDDNASPISPIGAAPKEENFDEILADMKAMEKRYKHENEMIEAVSLGQSRKESFFASAFSNTLFEKRVPNLLRNAQNYCIIMNTLLRKAVEKGGVHPLYIDRVSSDFALKIESLSYPPDTPSLMREMFTTYSKLVQNHTMSGYCDLVKDTVLLIDSDISAPISPSAIAKTLGVSPGYLSSLFKKETNKTLTEYIADKRIAYAKHLLATTQIQIQAVALRCGIVDVQYFSKIFKKKTGQTPKQYRESTCKK